MKKIAIELSFVVLLFGGFFVFAQMNGGMKEGQESGMHLT
jgi:hypothetical protein